MFSSLLSSFLDLSTILRLRANYQRYKCKYTQKQYFKKCLHISLHLFVWTRENKIIFSPLSLMALFHIPIS